MIHRKKASILLIVMFTASAAAFTGGNLEPGESGEVNMTEVKTVINSNVGEVPGFVETLLGSQKINLHFEGELNETYLIETESTKVTDLEKGEFESPDVILRTNISTLKAVLSSEEPLETFARKLETGEIEHEEKGIANRIKFFLIDLLI